MREGLLWFDNDPRRDLKAKVLRAAAHYRQKHGEEADVCFVHPSMLEENGASIDVEGVHIAALPSVLRHHFWVGKGRDEQ
jgi:hypothetical protein